MTAPTYACDALVATSRGMPRRCKRLAAWSWLLRDGTYSRYCSKHHDGAGVSRLLRPLPWDVVSRVRVKDEV